MISTAMQGVVAANYAKKIAAATQWNAGFDPSSGGRRAYAASDTSYGAPSYTDTPGWTWPAGGPLSLPSYQLQIRMTASRFESCSAGTPPSHHSGLEIGGTNTGVLLEDQAVGQPTTAWANVANSVSGAVHMHDYCTPNRGGGNAFTGTEIIFYQYIRA